MLLMARFVGVSLAKKKQNDESLFFIVVPFT